MTMRGGAVGGATALAMLLGALVACSDDDSVFNAEVGECIDTISDLSGDISELPETSCDDAHEGQIIGLFEHEGADDDFPGGDELSTQAQASCEGDAFEDFTGTSFAESAILVTYITPSEASWGEGDRETICVGFTGEDVDSTFEDNGEDFLLSG